MPASSFPLAAVGRLPATNRLQLSIGLPLRNTNGLAALLAGIYDPASPQFRHYLTQEDFTKRFGPTEADYNSVIAFFRANRFKVQGIFSNRMLVDVEGSVTDVEKTFRVTLNNYAHPKEKRNFFAPDTEPSLALATPILHVSGLDNYVIPHPFLHEMPLANQTSAATPLSGSGPSGNYAGLDFRAAYAPGVTLDGTGQSVALVEFGGYFGQDITNYENTFGLPHVPLVNVLLNGVNLTNNASAEEPLDIEMAIDMATNLTSVVIYYGSSGDSVLNQIASDNTCKQIGASWGYGSDSDSTMQQDFQEFAAQGQSYFNASGDSDADVGSPFSPSDPSYVISVGGTTLTTSGARGSWVSEKVWNWGGGTGGSGGVSTLFLMPPWQQGVDMTAAQGSSTMRNIPDVAMTADNIYVYYNNGSKGSFGGTSCATPLWAGFTALINQQATANNYPTVGFLNPAVYAIGKSTNYTTVFRDITTGNNTSPSSPSKYYAVSGYDLCTGWGTPNGQALINALATPGPVRAAAISWTPPATISGDTDVCKWGNALYAYDWNNVNQAVNGVSFTGSSSTTGGGANVALSGVNGGNYTAFTATSNPYNALSAAYKNILAGGDYTSSTTTLIVTLKNLIAGHIYAAQVWVNDARSTGNGRTEIAYGNNGGNSVTLDYNSSNAAGGVGQSSIGVFTADGTSDSFTLDGNASTQINALQVRDVTGCAWNFWGGYANGNWDFTTTNWGNGQTFSATSNLFSAVNFADTNFYGATIVNNLVSLPTSGVSLGAVNFVNNSVNYTLQNSGGLSGITGTTAVNVSGSGSVFFNGTNTYTGATTVNNGTLALSSSGAISGSSQLVLNGGIFDATALGNFTAASSQPISFGGGTLVASNLTLNGVLFTNTVINPAAPFIVATNLIYGATASKVIVPVLSGFAAYPVQFPLVQYSGSASGTFNLSTLTLPAGYAGYLSNNVANNSVDLVLTAGGGLVVPLAWKGSVNGNWDILATANWVNSTNTASAQKFENGSAVQFDDSATGTTNIALQTTLQPANVTVSNNALNYAFSGGQLSGAMSLTKSGSGTLSISSSDNFTGGTTISSGTLQVNTATAAGSGAIADGGTLNVNISANTLSNSISGAGIVNILETANASTSLAGSLAGFTGTLNIPASSGTSKTAITSTSVNLSSAATINIASGGTLYVNTESIPAAINVSGIGNSENYGALLLDNGASASGTISLLGNGAIGSYVGGGMVTGTITDGGAGYSVLFEGTGTTILFSANTYSGGSIFKTTTVALRNGAALGTNLVTVTNSSTLCVNGNSLTNPVTIASGQTLTLYSSATMVGQISGAGALTASGGTVSLKATNTYTGNTSESSGTLQIGGAGLLGNGSYAGNISIGSGNILEFSSSANQTFAGTVSGSGLLTKDTSSSSTLTLAGTVSYTGATTISAGKLVLPSTAAATGAVTNKANAKLGVTVSGTSQWKPASLSLASSCALEFNNVQNSGTTTAPILPTAALPTVSGVTINVNSISGVTAVGNSYPLLGNAGATNGYALGTQPAGITGHLALGSDNSTLVYVVDVNSPADTWAGTDSRHTNYWDVATSTNWVNHALLNSPVGSYATGDAVVFDDTASPPSPVPVLIQAAVSPASVNFNNIAKNYTVTASGANVISGTNVLNLNGSGTVTLAGGAHTYTGATVINSGTLQLGDGTANGDATIANTSAVTNNGGLVFNCFSNRTAGYVISGSGSVTKQGAGTISLTGTDTYTGSTTINGGTLAISSTGEIYNTSGGSYVVTVNSGATLQVYSWQWAAAGSIGASWIGAGDLIVNGGTITYTGIGENSGQNNGRNFTIGTGGATLNAAGTGTWHITQYGADNFPQTIGSGLTLTMTGSSNGQYDDQLLGGGALVKSGSGTWILTYTNTYTGGTTINGGTLLVNNTAGSGTGTGAVNINSGGTLGGTGKLAGAVTNNAGGTLTPGNSGIGTLTFGSSLNLNSGSTTLMELSKTNSVTTNDLISVAGTLTLGGTLTVTNLTTNALAAGNSFDLFNAGTFTGNFTSKTLPALATNLVWDTSQLTNNGIIAVVALPAITNQPQSLTVIAGNSASFAAGATGTATLAYQWLKNGIVIAGATTNPFTIASATTNDTANYSVIITNNYGAVTSAVATLTVNVRPAISTPPQSVTVYVNSNATFSVAADGTPAPAFQWQFNGANLAGATATNFTVTSAQTTNEGNYTVFISNAAGFITSSPASLSLYREFGCAPAPYPSALASNGARHLIVPGYQLGTTNLASTDARTNTFGEEGVMIVTTLQAGQTANVQVVASAAGYLNAWIDFNTNGAWSDAGDQVFTNVALTAGTNTLALNVPATAAATSNTWARFRFSSVTNLSFTGEAPDGEVEDYPLAITGLTLTYLAGGNGSISGVATQTVSYAGSGSPVTAVAADGYAFTDWSDGLTVNPRTDTGVTNNLTVTANFFCAMLTPPVLAANSTLTASGLLLIFSGPSGQTFKVLGSTNLVLPMSAWTMLTNGTFGAGPASYLDNALTNQASFYRIVSP